MTYPRTNSTTWPDLPRDTRFGIANLPYGVFAGAGEPPRVGVRIGEDVLDLAAAFEDPIFAQPTLNGFMAEGAPSWRAARTRIQDLLTDSSATELVRSALYPLTDVRLHMPFEVADYVDFYASEQHASNVGRMFRPESAPLKPNWKHLPVGYHGRAATVVPSGTPIVRPNGQRIAAGQTTPSFGPCTQLDLEAEVGFVVGAGSRLGEPVRVADFAEHVFGVCLVNDWSARDMQAWETAPLGPFLGKSFATSISPWVVSLEALAHAWVPPPPRDPEPLAYLTDTARSGLDINLEVGLNGQVVSRPPFAAMYWTPAQMLAHMTVNGASSRTGDLFASGTVSGDEADQRGSLLELSWGGATPIELPDGSTRSFLRDDDEVTITATAAGPGPTRIGLGEVSGQVSPAVRLG